jgi:hypothetical protein
MKKVLEKAGFTIFVEYFREILRKNPDLFLYNGGYPGFSSEIPGFILQ